MQNLFTELAGVRPFREAQEASFAASMAMYGTGAARGGRRGTGAWAECGVWATPSTYADSRDPELALFAWMLATGGYLDSQGKVVPSGMTTDVHTCFVRMLREKYGDEPFRTTMWTRDFMALEQARLKAGGYPLDSSTPQVLMVGAKVRGWTPTDVTQLTRAGLAMDWASPDWLEAWSKLTRSGSTKVDAMAVPWFKNPWMWGAGGLLVLGGAYWLTR